MLLRQRWLELFNHEMYNAREALLVTNKLSALREIRDGSGHFCPYVTAFWDTWPYKTSVVRTEYPSSTPFDGIYWKFIVLSFTELYIDVSFVLSVDTCHVCVRTERILNIYAEIIYLSNGHSHSQYCVHRCIDVFTCIFRINDLKNCDFVNRRNSFVKSSLAWRKTILSPTIFR